MTLTNSHPSRALAGRSAELEGKPSSEAQLHLAYCVTALSNKSIGGTTM